MITNLINRIKRYRAEKSDRGRDIILDALFKLWDKMKEKGKSSADNYLNTCIYILLVNRDIFYLYNLFFFTKNPSKRNFYGRLLSMTIIEYLKDINELIGKHMIQEIIKNKWDVKLIDELKIISKSYSKLKNDFEKDFIEVRNNASAHKTKDARKLFDLTKNEFNYLKLICPILRLIEIEFEEISMKFEQLSD